jgi:3-hydroxybutyryl-CoA dehydratase
MQMQTQTLPERGASLSFRKTMTVAEQAMYTGISGNLAQLHVDAAAARAAGFPNMLSFELAVLSLATSALNRLAGPAWRIGALDMRFDAPVAVGSTIEASATVTEADPQALHFDVTCTIDGGARAIRGSATMVPLIASA